MGQGVSGYGIGYIYFEGTKYRVMQTTNHTISVMSTPNSVCQKLDADGKFEKERYYDENGNPVIDIDYTDHGNAKKHPKIPHKHRWDCSDPKHPIRRKEDD